MKTPHKIKFSISIGLFVVTCLLFSFFFSLTTFAHSSEITSNASLLTKEDSNTPLRFFSIKNLTMYKNPEDLEKEDLFIYEDSLPFTLIVEFDRDFQIPSGTSLQIVFTGDESVLYKKDHSTPVAECNYTDSTFIFEDLLYTGNGSYISFLLFNETDQYYFSWNASQLSARNSTSSNVDNSSNINSSKISSSSSKTTSNNTSSASRTSLTPHLLPISFSYEDSVNGLEPFPVKVTVQNFSETLTIENIVLTLSPDKNLLSIIDSSMVQYIRTLSPGERTSFTIYCIVSDLTQSVSFTLTASFEYYDIEKSNPSKSSDKSTIPLSFIHASGNPTSSDLPSSELRLESITVPENAYDHLSFSLGYRLANIGQSDLSHVDLSLTDSNGEEIARLFLGVLKYGQTVNSPEIPLTFGEVGTYSLTLTAYYRDGYGNQKKSAKTFQLVIEPQENAPDFPTSSSTEEIVSTKSATVYVSTKKGSSFEGIVWLICLSIIGITLFAIKKMRSEMKLPTTSLDDFEQDDSAFENDRTENNK